MFIVLTTIFYQDKNPGFRKVSRIFCFIGKFDFNHVKKKRMFVEHTLDKREKGNI